MTIADHALHRGIVFINKLFILFAIKLLIFNILICRSNKVVMNKVISNDAIINYALNVFLKIQSCYTHKIM